MFRFQSLCISISSTLGMTFILGWENFGAVLATPTLSISTKNKDVLIKKNRNWNENNERTS